MKLTHVFLAIAIVAVAVVGMAGWRGHHFSQPPFEVFPDMNYQDKVKDQQASAFFADGIASRAPIDGTVAEEMPARNDYWATGKWDDTHWGDGIPVHGATGDAPALAVDDVNLARGRERYTIDCAMCHGVAGKGDGITSKYGFNGAANYNTDRLRTASDGDIFNTITNGKGQMMGYGYNINIDDRWRIVMYIRALQHSENAKLQDASLEEQRQLQAPKKPAGSAMNNSPSASKLFFGRNSLGDWTPRDMADHNIHALSSDEKSWLLLQNERLIRQNTPPANAKPVKNPNGSMLDPTDEKSAVVYLDQHTMKNWRDSILPEAP
jgi:mono/diheme cytochrome c family protein